METPNNKEQQQGRHEHPLPNEISNKEKETTRDAHKQADKDMNEDAELTSHNPLEDLDEGEAARVGGDKNDLV